MPSNYDDAGITISVDPNSLYQYASSEIPGHIKNFTESISRIVGVWKKLNDNKVGWAGKSASEAQDFDSRWSTAVSGLFGTDSDPSSGVLAKIAVAVAQAAENYGVAEGTIVTNLQEYIDGLNTPPAGGGRPVNSPPTRGGSGGPVSEQGPPPPSTPPPSPAAPPTTGDPGSKNPFG